MGDEVCVTVEILESSAQHMCDALTKAKTIGDVMVVKGRLDELHGQLHEGMEKWPQYDIRRGQEMVQMVEKSIDLARERIQPRRRFRFASASRAKEITTADILEKNKGTSENDIFKRYQAFNMGLDDVSIEKGSKAADSANGVVIVKVNEDSTKVQSGEVNRRAVVVTGSGKGVHILLSDGALSVRVFGLRCCIINTGVVNGPVWIAECSSCAIYSDCHQLRVHDSHNCTLRVSARSAPIIERCHDMRLGPIQSIRNTQLQASEGQETNPVHYSKQYEGGCFDVIDMSWLRESKSSNWRYLRSDDDDNTLINETRCSSFEK